MNAIDTEEPLLPLQTADLSATELDDLFRDLAACAHGLTFTIKGGETERGADFVAPGTPDEQLHTLKSMLTSQKIRGVQVRYRYQDKGYCDTLLCLPTGIRLVRSIL